MPDRHDPNAAHFSDYYAVAQYKIIHLARLFWRCKCGAQNQTDLDQERLQRCLPWKIEARCGRCHGPVITLVDCRGNNYTQARLQQHL